MTSGVGTLLTELAERREVLAAEITDRIRAEVPGYAKLPYAEHHRDVHDQIKNVLDGLRTRQVPPATAIDHARAVGRRRAGHQLALPDVIEAYHIAYREIWNELLSLAKDYEPDLTPALVTEVALLWNWFHRLSATVASAHAEETHTRAATQLALRRQFVETLTGRAASSEEQDGLARSLGFDPDGEFVVACAAGVPETRIDQINTALAEAPGVAHCAYDSGRVVLVAQRCASEHLLAAVPTALVGIGLSRTGLAGAELSLADAVQALGRARATGRSIQFADDWLMTLLTGARDRLDPLFASGVATAAQYPQLAQTVQAFADGRYSISACARLLHIHPNSAKYRLERWQTLTGWDVRTVPGLVSSLVCLELCQTADTAG